MLPSQLTSFIKIIAVSLSFGKANPTSRDNFFLHEEGYCCANMHDNYTIEPRDSGPQPVDYLIKCGQENSVMRCGDVIKKRVGGKKDGGSYLIEKDPEPLEISFTASLLSIDGLSHKGELELTLRIVVSWSSGAGWDDSVCEKENLRTNSCALFVDRTRKYEWFVTKPEATKIYEFFLVNDTHGGLLSQMLQGYPLKVHRDGTALWKGTAHVALSCYMDVCAFPFDRQNCSIQWRMRPPLPHVNVSFENVGDLSKTANHSGWKTESFHCENGTYFLVMRRNAIPTLSTLLVPIVLFDFLGCLVYLLPSSSGERVGFAVTLVLSYSVLIMTIKKMIPPSSGTMAIVVLVFSTFGKSVVAMVETIVVIFLAKTNKKSPGYKSASTSLTELNKNGEKQRKNMALESEFEITIPDRFSWLKSPKDLDKSSTWSPAVGYGKAQGEMTKANGMAKKEMTQANGNFGREMSRAEKFRGAEMADGLEERMDKATRLIFWVDRTFLVVNAITTIVIIVYSLMAMKLIYE